MKRAYSIHKLNTEANVVLFGLTTAFSMIHHSNAINIAFYVLASITLGFTIFEIINLKNYER